MILLQQILHGDIFALTLGSEAHQPARGRTRRTSTRLRAPIVRVPVLSEPTPQQLERTMIARSQYFSLTSESWNMRTREPLWATHQTQEKGVRKMIKVKKCLIWEVGRGGKNIFETWKFFNPRASVETIHWRVKTYGLCYETETIF